MEAEQQFQSGISAIAIPSAIADQRGTTMTVRTAMRVMRETMTTTGATVDAATTMRTCAIATVGMMTMTVRRAGGTATATGGETGTGTGAVTIEVRPVVALGGAKSRAWHGDRAANGASWT